MIIFEIYFHFPKTDYFVLNQFFQQQSQQKQQLEEKEKEKSDADIALRLSHSILITLLEYYGLSNTSPLTLNPLYKILRRIVIVLITGHKSPLLLLFNTFLNKLYQHYNNEIYLYVSILLQHHHLHY